MKSVSLIVADQTPGGSLHVKLFLDEKESGILYLNEEQFHTLGKFLRSSCFESNIDFEIENPFDSDSGDDIEEE